MRSGYRAQSTRGGLGWGQTCEEPWEGRPEVWCAWLDLPTNRAKELPAYVPNPRSEPGSAAHSGCTVLARAL